EALSCFYRDAGLLKGVFRHRMLLCKCCRARRQTLLWLLPGQNTIDQAEKPFEIIYVKSNDAVRPDIPSGIDSVVTFQRLDSGQTNQVGKFAKCDGGYWRSGGNL